jgi:hypothetical protein
LSKKVELSDYPDITLEFPDEATPEQIQKYVDEKYPEQAVATPPPQHSWTDTVRGVGSKVSEWLNLPDAVNAARGIVSPFTELLPDIGKKLADATHDPKVAAEDFAKTVTNPDHWVAGLEDTANSLSAPFKGSEWVTHPWTTAVSALMYLTGAQIKTAVPSRSWKGGFKEMDPIPPDEAVTEAPKIATEAPPKPTQPAVSAEPPTISSASFFDGIKKKALDIEKMGKDASVDHAKELQDIQEFLKNPTVENGRDLADSYGIRVNNLSPETLFDKPETLGETSETLRTSTLDIDALVDEVVNFDDPEYRTKVFNPDRFTTSGDVHYFIDKVAAKEVANPKRKTLVQTEQEAHAYLQEKAKVGLGYDLSDLKTISKSFEEADSQIQGWTDVMVESKKRLDVLAKAAKESGSPLDKTKFGAHYAYHTDLVNTLKGVSTSSSRILGAYRIKHNGFPIKWSELTPEMVEADAAVKKLVTDGASDLDGLLNNYNPAEDVASLNKKANNIYGTKFWNSMLEYTNGNILASPGVYKIQLLTNVPKLFYDQVYTPYSEALMNKVFRRGEEYIPDRANLAEANSRAVAMFHAAVDAFIYNPLDNIAKKFPMDGSWGQKGGGFGGPKAEPTTKATLSQFLLDLLDAPEKMEDAVYDASHQYGASKVQDVVNDKAPKILSQEYLTGSKDGGIFWKAFDALGASVRLPAYGALSVLDAPFKMVHYRAERAALAYKEIAKQGLESPEAASKAIETLMQDVDKFAEGIPIQGTAKYLKKIETIHAKSIDAANKGVWQEDMSGQAAAFSTWLQHVPFARFLLFRFFKTPVNLLKETYYHTPVLGALNKTMMEDLQGTNGVSAQNKAILKQLTGTLVFMGGMYVVKNGWYVGKHHQDVKTAFKDAGIPENAIYIPSANKWIETRRLDPYFMPLDFIYDLNYLEGLIDADRYDELANTAILFFGNSVLNKTYLQSTSNFFNMLADPEYKSEQWLTSIETSLLPRSGLSKAAQDSEDALQREVRGYLDAYRNIYDRQENRPMLDWLGVEKKNDGRLASLKQTKTLWDRPVLMEAANLGVTIPAVPKTLYGHELTDEEYHQYQSAINTQFHLESTLENIIDTPEWKNSESMAIKAEIFKKVISSVRSAAGAWFMTATPERRKDIANEAQTGVAKLLQQGMPNKLDGVQTNWSEVVKPKPKVKIDDNTSFQDFVSQQGL